MRRPTRLPCSRSTCDERLLVVLEWLRQEPRSRRLMPEYVGEPHLVAHPLHARLQQLQVRSVPRSEEHTSELQSPCNLVCRLLLEKKKKKNIPSIPISTNPYRRCADTMISARGYYDTSVRS